MSTKVSLKPCPFCGGEAVRAKMKIKGAVPNEEEDGYAHYVRCLSCAATGGWSKARGGAGGVRQWNMRNGKRCDQEVTTCRSQV